MSLIELNELLNRDCKDNYNGGEYTTNILDRQYAFAGMFPNLISEVKLNGISSPMVCPDLGAYNTAIPSSEAFMLYNDKIRELSSGATSLSTEAEILEVGRSR